MVFQNYALYPHMTVADNMGFALKLAKVDKAEINSRVEDAAKILDLTAHLDRKPANLSGGQRQRVAMGRAIVRDPKVFLMDEPLSNLDAKLRVQMRAEIKQRVAEAARILELEPYLQRKPRQLSGGQRQRVAMGRAIVRQPRAFLMDEPLSNLDAKLRVQMRAEIAQLQRSLGTTTIYVTHDQTEAMTLGTRVAVIQGGVLQQVAAPQELYSRPANLFVAGFIGSPAMNLVDARLERDEQSSRLAVVFGTHRLLIPPPVIAQHPALEQYQGQGVVLGIRPENMQDAALAHEADPQAIIQLPVKLREELGSEVQIHGAIGTAAHTSGGEAEDVRSLATMVARMDPRTAIKEGDVARVLVDTAALHFFDRTSGASIRG